MSPRKRAYTPEQMQALEAKIDEPAYQPVFEDADEEKTTLLSTLEAAQARQPRSMQRAIGPSEMGGACIHCLAARLWGVPRITHGSQATWIGTGAHLMNQQAFDQADPQHERYLTEYKVHVGDIRFNPLGAELATVPYGAEPPHGMILLASHVCGRPPLSDAPVKPPAHRHRPQPDLGEALCLGKEDSRCVMPRLF